MSTTQPTLATYAVCYLDMLGYEDLVKRATEKPGLISEIRDRLKTALDKIKSARERKPNDKYGETFVKVFQLISARMVSDSILMTMCVDDLPQLHEELDRSESKLLCLEQFLGGASYLCSFIPAKLGYFFRGAITIGQYYENQFDGNLFIFSKALVDAVRMSKEGPPRVMIDETVFRFACDIFPDTVSPTADFHGHAFQDADGKWCLDVYNSLLPDRSQTQLCLSELAKAMRAQIASHAADFRIMDKYRWLARYHNERVVNRFKMPDLRIPEWDVLVRFQE